VPTPVELWSHRGWLATISLLGLVGGAIFGMVALRPAYSSSAQVLVHPMAPDPTKTPEPVSNELMGTERELVSADGVVGLVQEQTGWPGSPADLRRGLSVSVVGTTQTMTIRYRSGSAERARMGAQLFAESYLAYRGALAASTRDGSRQNLEAALRGVNDRVERIRESLSPTAAGTQAANEALL
jgi:succinoglycan biosynthesis transport protein ExoP